MDKIVLELKNIVKEFPGVRALNKVSFDLREGEVHALVGENGSGKSTLMNIISGVYQPDSGEIYLKNTLTHFKDTKDAQEKGVSMIHQELSLAPNLSVMENIFIGRQLKNRFGFIDFPKMRQKCTELLQEFGIVNVEYNDIVKNLSLSQMQLIEIAKAIFLNNKILIMDEPTAALTKMESQNLFDHIGILKRNGCSLVFISHRLDEVKQIADRITILRDGNFITTKNNEEIEIREIISQMVGRKFENRMKRSDCSTGEKILEVKRLQSSKLHDVNFYLKKGEVLGITGLVGSGRTELLQTIFGDMKYDSGEIMLFGRKTAIHSVGDAIKSKMGLIPEGRKTQGLFPILSVDENTAVVKRNDLSKLGFINFKILERLTREIKERLKIKTPAMQTQIRYLSGGNQQKVIIGRWLINDPQILFLDEPTHGIDVGAKAEIYQIIDDLSRQGVSVVLVSSELPEVLTLCDRVIVMHQGRIKGEYQNIDLTQEMIINAANNQAI